MATGRSLNGEVINTHGALGTDQSRISPTILYVNKIASDGWLQAQVADSLERRSLCKYTKVKIIESKRGRTYFKVLDGSQANETLTLADANAKEYLGTKAPIQSKLDLLVTYGKYEEKWVSVARRGQKLDQQWATLAAGNGLTVAVTMNTAWDGTFFPLPAGEYTVLLPDTPHNKDMTRFYRDTEPKLKYDQVWFPIVFGDNSRYVHVGNVSDGCVTVTDLAQWADIQEALISHRGADGKSVARLVVSGKPERAK